MKIIFQILVILVVAALIGGALYAAVSAAGNGTQTRERAFDGERPAPLDGQFRPERDGRRDRESFEGGIMLPFGMVKSLALMSIIGVPYFLWKKRSVWGSQQASRQVNM